MIRSMVLEPFKVRRHKADWLVKGIAGLAVLFFLLGYVLLPLGSTLRSGAGVVSRWVGEGNITCLTALGNSLVLALTTVLFSGLLGTLLAYLLYTQSIVGKRWLFVVLLFPVAAPSLIGTVAFQYLVDRHGLLAHYVVGQQFMTHWFSFRGWWAVLVVHLYSFYPLFMLFVLTALRKWDHQITESAQMLGAREATILFRLLLPYLRPALSGAALVVFMSSMASFSAPFLYGQSIRLLTTEIYYAKMNGSLDEAAGYATLLMAICLLLPLLFRKWEKGQGTAYLSKGSTLGRLPQRAGTIAWTSTFVGWIVGVLVTLPFLSLLYISLLPEGALLRPNQPHGVTLANYRQIFADAAVLTTVWHTLLNCGLTIGMMLVVGGSVAYWITGSHYRVGRWVEVVALLPNAIPGTVLALGFMLAFNESSLFTGFLPTLVGTFMLLPLVYVVRSLPMFTQALVAALREVSVGLKEPAYLLGAPGWYTYQRVIIPLIKPAIGYGSLLVGIHAAEEFVVTVMLYTYNTRTVSIEIYALIQQFNNAGAAALGVLHTLVVLLLLTLFNQNSLSVTTE